MAKHRPHKLHTPIFARKFDGSSSTLKITSAPITDYPATLACFAKFDTLGAQRDLVGIFDISETDTRVRIGPTALSIINAQIDNAGTTLNAAGGGSATAIATNRVHHIAGVYRTSADIEAYKDGRSEGTGTSPTTTWPGGLDTLAIGYQADSSPTNYMDGQIWWVGYWNVALSAGEIRALAQGRPPYTIRPENLVSFPDLQTLWDPILGAKWTQTNTTPALAPIGQADQVMHFPSVFAPSTQLIYRGGAPGGSVAPIPSGSPTGSAETRTGPVVESLVSIPNPVGDQLWMIVNRTIDGGTNRHIEFMEDRFEPIEGTLKNANDAFYVDSGVTIDTNISTDIVTGLDHLEQETVSILVDGKVHADKLVSGGQVTLDYTGNKIHAGLSYESNIVTMPLVPKDLALNTNGRILSAASSFFSFDNTLGGRVGKFGETLDDIELRKGDDLMDTQVSLFSGLHHQNLVTSGDRRFQIHINQDQPLPMMVLSFAADLDIGEG